MTTAATPPALVPLRIERQGLYLLDEDEVVRVLGPVQTREVRPVQEQQATYGVEWQRMPLILWGDGARPNYGLAPLLVERGRRVGREVRLVSGNQEFCRLEVPDACPAQNRGMLSWIANSELGIVEHGRRAGVTDLLREVIQCFRDQATIAVLYGSEHQQERATEPLSPNWIGGTLLRARFDYEEPPRVAVGTFRNAAREDVGIHDFDIVIVPRATDALSEYAQRALSDVALHCRLIGLLPDDERLSPASRGRLLATFGARRYSVPQLGRVQRVVNLALLHLPEYEVEDIEHEVRFLRQAVWRNDSFNDLLAAAADSIAAGEARNTWLSPRSPTQIEDLGENTNVVIGCDNVEHALELAKRLPEWQINLGTDCYLDGLSPDGLAALRRRRDEPAWSPQACRKRIFTADAFRTYDLSGVSIIIWAGTGGGLPPIESQTLIVDPRSPASSRPLLVVDVENRSHRKLRRASRERCWLYVDRGWLPEGADEATSRLVEFDAEISDASWQERDLVRSARRRHWFGEMLPRRVLSGRFYLEHGQHRTSSPVTGTSLRPLNEVIHHENLLETYHRMRECNGPGAGTDGLSYGDFSWGEIARILRHASTAIREGRYRPHPTRLVRIPKTNGFRDLDIMCIVDRVVATALADALQPVIDPRFLHCSYGFRPDTSPQQMLAQVLNDITTNARYVVAVEDVKNAFPTVPIRPLLALLGTVLEEIQATQSQTDLSDWLPLLATMIWGAYPAAREKGLEQGNPLSPMLLNLLLDVVLDRPLCVDRGDTPWFRYADNLCYLGHDTAECRQLLARVGDLLRPYEMNLKGWPPINLQGAGNRVRDFLGFALTLVDGTPRLSVKDTSYRKLSDNLVDCYETSYPGRTAILVVRNWIQSQGPALETQEEGFLERVYRAAVHSGFRELGSMGDLHSAIQESRTRWLGVRSQVAPAFRQSHL